MMNYKLTCEGDGYTKTVSAASKEEAVQMFMSDEEVKKHVAENHPEKAAMTPEEMTTMLMGMVTEEVAAPAGGAM